MNCGNQHINMFCLFVHVGRIYGGNADILFMPLGLPMLAGLLQDNGFKSRIFNETAAQITGGPLITDLVRQHSPKIIAMPIHWHQQLPFVIDKIEEMKRLFPEITVISGGFTASYFAKEILSLPISPDFIIRGDGEIPLLEFAKSFSAGNTDFSSIPNLAWKKKNIDGKHEICINPISYIAESSSISGLRYDRYDLVINKQQCMHDFFSFMVNSKDKDTELIENPPLKTVFYNPGRGCPYMCSYCGGNNKVQQQINGRSGYFFKSIDSAVKDIQGFVSQGFELIHICFDPDPAHKYYFDFFDKVRKENMDFACVFEAWGCPDSDFLHAFAETFKKKLKKCRITISPESFSETVRRTNKFPFYTNEQLEKAIIIGNFLGIPMEASFMSSLPGETAADFIKTIEFGKKFKDIYGCEVNMGMPVLEPGSCLYENPEKYGLKTLNKGFTGFMENRKGSIDIEHKDRPWGTAEKRCKYFKEMMKRCR